MKKFLNDVMANIVANIVVFLITAAVTSVVSIGASVFIIISKTKGMHVPLYLWGILVVSLIVGIGCFTFDIVYFIKKSARPVFPALVSDVRYEKAITELFFKDRENILCNREVKLVVLCDKLEKISKQFTWTGSGYKKTVLEKSMGNYTITDSPRKNPPQSYEVVFDSVKRCGDKVGYKTRTEVEDTQHIMHPFLSHLVKGPTDYLELRVTAPVGLLKNVQFLEYADTSAEIPISKPLPLNGKNVGNLETFEYIIKSPGLLHNYRIEWNF